MAARWLGTVAIATLLAACGGGGGSGDSGGSGGSGGIGSATPQSGFVLPAGSGSTVIALDSTNHDAAVVRYTSGGTASVSFGSVTRTWSVSPKVVGDVEVTESSDGRTVVVTARGGSGGSTSSSSLQYTSYGIWLESNATSVLDGSSGEVTSVSSFVIGDPTPLAAMPRSGSATYRGQAVGVELRGAQLPRTLSGPFDASVDFNSGRIDATADLSGAGDGSAFGRVTMSGLAISGNRFSGSAGASGYTGSVKGGFSGPSASELGGAFELDGASTVHGAFAARAR